MRTPRVIGRLKPGVSAGGGGGGPERNRRIACEGTGPRTGSGVVIESLRGGLVRPELRLTSILLASIVGFLL